MNLQELIQQFQKKPRTNEAYSAFSQFLETADSEMLGKFVAGVLTAVPEGGTFLDAALSHVSDADFDQLIAQAIALIEQRGNTEATDSIVAYASLQRLEGLQPYLERIFALQPNNRSYYENWPWRAAGSTDIEFLCHVLDSGQVADKFKAWRCLLETRRPDALLLAMQRAGKIESETPLEYYFKQIDHASIDEPLYREKCSHLIFTSDYLDLSEERQRSRALHPTWRLHADGPTWRFGGEGSAHCGLCGDRLHHLITLPESEVFSPAGNVEATVSLEVCLSCVKWEKDVLYYRHDKDGLPQSLDSGSVKPQFIAKPLLATQVHLAHTPKRWRWQDWALSNGRENLHRIGGGPTWIQNADYPNCPSCGAPMRFMMQLDSDLPMETDDNEVWLWGSGGIGYGFKCHPCRTTAYHWQCT